MFSLILSRFPAVGEGGRGTEAACVSVVFNSLDGLE